MKRSEMIGALKSIGVAVVVAILLMICYSVFNGDIGSAGSDKKKMEQEMALCYGFYKAKALEYSMETIDAKKYYEEAVLMGEAYEKIITKDIEKSSSKINNYEKNQKYLEGLNYLHKIQGEKGKNIFINGSEAEISNQLKSCYALKIKRENDVLE